MVDVQGVMQRLESLQVERRLPKRIRELEGDGARAGSSTDAAPQSLGFGEMLMDGIREVSDRSQDVRGKLEGLVTGETDDVHEVLSAMGKSEVAFSLMLEIRNKLTDAWKEISRIQV